tara:strand:+ start:17857 stop:19761 length:1905 start_codon:yes stop_codon:yes gene_type:complete
VTNLKEKDIEQDEHDRSQHSGKQVREASDSSITMGKKAIVSKILGSSRVQNALRELAVKEGLSQSEAHSRARRSLQSLVAVQKPLFTTLFDRVLAPMHTNAWTVDVDQESLRRLEVLSRDNMLVFLPTHRSYADPFILTQLISSSALPRNYILGGDNIGFWPMGSVVRRSGAILIRRSFGDDRVYKLMIKEYLAYLARSGGNLEWYMEGGRSRTGKLRPPMYGLLRYLGQALSVESRKSVILVPVAITYDQLHEIWGMAAEEAGNAKKAKEGLPWLANYARMQSKWIGTAYVRFGELMSLTEAMHPDSKNPSTIEKVAIEVFQRINKVTPVTGPALATLALLAVRNRALTLPEITHLVSPLLDYARRRALPTEVVDELDNHSGIEDALSSLAKADVLDCYKGGLEPIYNIRAGSHNIAAYYRNSAIHWFINRAILEVTLLHTSHINNGDENIFDQGWNDAHALRDVLKFEFFFSEKNKFKEEMREEALILDADFFAKVQRAEERRNMLYQAPFLMAHRVLMPFMEAYVIVAELMASKGGGTISDESLFIAECLSVGRQWVLQYKIRSPESLSQELFKNALKLAKNRDLLEQRLGLHEDRLALKDYLHSVVAALANVESLDLERCANSQEGGVNE